MDLTVKKSGFQSLAFTLTVVFVALSALILLISSSLNIYLNFQNQQKFMIAHQQLIAKNAADTVRNFIQDKFDVLERAGYVTGLAAAGREGQKIILERMLGKMPYFRQLVLLDAHGKELMSVSRLSKLLSAGLLEYDRKGMFSKVSQKETYISPVYIDKMTNEPMIIMAVAVTDVFGDFKGVFIAEMNLKFMWELVDSIKIGSKGLAYVVDRQGNLLAFSDISRVLKGENLAYLKEVNEFVSGKTAVNISNAEIEKGIRGTYVVANHVALGTPDWAVVVELPVPEAYEPVTDGIKLSVIAMLASFVFAALSGIYLAGRITSPVIKLRDAAEKVGKGDLTAGIKIESKNEIGELAGSFNKMIEELSKTLVSRDYINDIINTITNTLIVTDVNGKIRTINKAGINMLGFEKDEIIGQSIGLFFEGIQPGTTGLNAKGEGNIETNGIKKDGKKIPVIFSFSVMKNEDGKVDEYVFTAIDITDRKEAEIKLKKAIEEIGRYNIELEESRQKLQESYEKLKDMDKLKNNFLSMVSHELRTPLTSIMGFVSFLQKGAGGRLTEKQNEWIGIIDQSSKKLLSLINELVDMSKLESGTFSIIKARCDINELVSRSIKEMNSILAGKNIRIIRQFEGGEQIIQADDYRISQVVTNLFNNAMKFSPENSAITVGVEKRQIKDIEMPSYVNKNRLKEQFYVLISIRDQGLGISGDNQEKIFDRFYQVENPNTRKYQGAGLGLAIVKEIIEAHDGSIWAESEGLNKGSVFKVILPCTRAS